MPISLYLFALNGNIGMVDGGLNLPIELLMRLNSAIGIMGLDFSG